MILPEKETLPIIKPATINESEPTCPTLCSYSVNPIKAAQAPPIPLNIDTSSGIFVICTFLAVNQPITVPIAIPPKINAIFNPSREVSTIPSSVTLLYKNIVARMATTIPNAAIKFPLRADFGLPIIFKPKIKVTEPIKYDISNKPKPLFIITIPLFLILISKH